MKEKQNVCVRGAEPRRLHQVSGKPDREQVREVVREQLPEWGEAVRGQKGSGGSQKATGLVG